MVIMHTNLKSLRLRRDQWKLCVTTPSFPQLAGKCSKDKWGSKPNASTNPLQFPLGPSMGRASRKPESSEARPSRTHAPFAQRKGREQAKRRERGMLGAAGQGEGKQHHIPQTPLHTITTNNKIEQIMPADLTGKRIIITGAATGIGRSTAILAARCGAQAITIFDVDDTAAQEIAITINAEAGSPIAKCWHVDVADRPSVEGSTAAAVQWMGGVDVLLHFAGIMDGAYTPIESFEEATWDRVIDINLRGTYLIAKECVTYMNDQPNGGVIITTASGAGVIGGSSSYAYGASKGAVHGFTMVMQRHIDMSKIRVQDIAPGRVRTPLVLENLRQQLEITGDQARYDAEITSLIDPDDVAKIAVFMASDEAKAMRGPVFTR